ncbi:hypothetical protein [Allosaccharopolyspora coralli]|nr:hypothetical protein [Allosaccharopolyspora coralli]
MLRAVMSMIVVAAGVGGYWAVHRLGRFLDEPRPVEPSRALALVS